MTFRSILLSLFVSLSGCSLTEDTSYYNSRCWVPAMYLGVDLGLVMPTWEPRAEMVAQLPSSVVESDICWYGWRDGRVQARIRRSEFSQDAYMFEKQEDAWVHVETLNLVEVH